MCDYIYAYSLRNEYEKQNKSSAEEKEGSEDAETNGETKEGIK